MNKRSGISLPMWAWCLLAAGIALGTYILVLSIFGLSGFPLDDAWIHQTYARSLARTGQWAYWTGQVSAGSTTPLWTVLLIPGQLIPKGLMAWAYLLGWLGLAASAWLGQKAYENLTGQSRLGLPIMALFLCFEWHLVWAAGSGMETILAGLVVLAVFEQLSREKPLYWLAGGLAGLAVWIRPDGVTLLGPILFVILFSKEKWSNRARQAGWVMLGFLILFLPYLVFNKSLAGTYWPNTYYAKQMEYAILNKEALPVRFFRLMIQPMVGAGILLLPGAFWAFYLGFRRRRPTWMALGLFWIGFTLLYAWRLPVAYQHGRYLMPAMPTYFLLGFLGMNELVGSFGQQPSARLFRFGWQLAVTLTLLLFFFNGAMAISNDVGIIQTEMVATARWIQQNTPPNALVAAHDIGALGYYGERQLVDLAGLISPEVAPIIRDEEKLKAYLDERGVDYLVTFPGWYSSLTDGKLVLFQTDGKYSPAQGGENMAVYQWR